MDVQYFINLHFSVDINYVLHVSFIFFIVIKKAKFEKKITKLIVHLDAYKLRVIVRNIWYFSLAFSHSNCAVSTSI